jgi:hypothetical protein
MPEFVALRLVLEEPEMIQLLAAQTAEPVSAMLDIVSKKHHAFINKATNGTLVFAFKASAAAARERWSCKASATRLSCKAESKGFRAAVRATSLGSDMCRTGVKFRRMGAERGRRVTGAVLGRSAAAASARFLASKAIVSSRCFLHILTCSRTCSRSAAAAAAAAGASPSEAAVGADAVEGRVIV